QPVGLLLSELLLPKQLPAAQWHDPAGSVRAGSTGSVHAGPSRRYSLAASSGAGTGTVRAGTATGGCGRRLSTRRARSAVHGLFRSTISLYAAARHEPSAWLRARSMPAWPRRPDDARHGWLRRRRLRFFRRPRRRHAHADQVPTP